jgi:serine protease
MPNDLFRALTLGALTLVPFLAPTLAAQDQQRPKANPQLHVRGFANAEAAPALSSDRVVVRFRAPIDAEALGPAVRGLGLEIVDRGLHDAFVVLRCAPGLADAWVEWFAAQPTVEYAERDPIATTQVAPNDTFYPTYQWNFYNTGALSNGVPSNFGVQAEAAWDAGALGTGVTVAVIDSGVAYENFGSFQQASDLVGRTFVAPYDAVAGDGHPNDENGHGTHVAGTIGQVTNNAMGCAGIARNCTLMPIRVLNASGNGTYTQIANGIIWAADHGAHVGNLSLGGSLGSSTLSSAVTYATNAGVLLCAATGNTGRSGVQYPARYTSCIAVGATRFDGARSYYSTYGTGIDVVAPGGDVTIDQNGDGYGDGILQQTFSGGVTNFGYYFFQGTSMATPHVAAIAALVKSVRPAYTRAQLRSAIETSCRDLGATGYDTTFGAGLVNAAVAITR